MSLCVSAGVFVAKVHHHSDERKRMVIQRLDGPINIHGVI